MTWFNIIKVMNHAQYMVKSEVWLEAGFGDREQKSVTELEKILERELIADDFTDAPLNWDWDANWSWVNHPEEAQILKNRMGSEGRKKLAQDYLDIFWEYYPMARSIPKLMLLYEEAKKIVAE
jgi:hypothetical protein